MIRTRRCGRRRDALLSDSTAALLGRANAGVVPRAEIP